MTNREKILQFLKNNQSDHYCDDCLSNLVEIYPRQQINQICRKSRSIVRIKGDHCCSGECKKNKILNYVK